MDTHRENIIFLLVFIEQVSQSSEYFCESFHFGIDNDNPNSFGSLCSIDQAVSFHNSIVVFEQMVFELGLLRVPEYDGLDAQCLPLIAQLQQIEGALSAEKHKIAFGLSRLGALPRAVDC